MSESLPAGTGWAYGAHVSLSPWDASPVPGGPTYREIAAEKLRAEAPVPTSHSVDTPRGSDD